MKFFKLALLAILPLSFAAGPAAAHDSKIVVEKPWARASIGTSRPTAAFMMIKNLSDAADRLVSASTPAAGLVEIHQTRITDGKAQMIKMDGLTIPAGGKVMLKPGGYHIMLMKLKSSIKKGTQLPLTLVFEHGGTIKVDAMVMGPGSGGHHH